ncbi:inosine-uridine preferring nucleoside hydrolase [Klebsiella pneumoniae]|uniref:Inosine-uridine preferring nucleoside hydrolase n=1 Tax=Klebsiella pneumoniae TaxID=573 RepID=A0A377XP18_KLEPN|nr:inosine-uridine preferring nucleoside hydrolase [Klebsiella pneumoniae]
MRLPIILDTDPGIDDAAAIAAALFAPELDLQLMTTVAGNVSVEKTTRNALQLLHFWNADVPLAQGASMPLVRPVARRRLGAWRIRHRGMTLLSINVNRWRSRPSRRSVMRLCMLPSRSPWWRLAR